MPETLSAAIRGATRPGASEAETVPRLAELTVVTWTGPAFTDLARWERTQYIDLIAELLGKWRKDTSSTELRH